MADEIKNMETAPTPSDTDPWGLPNRIVAEPIEARVERLELEAILQRNIPARLSNAPSGVVADRSDAIDQLAMAISRVQGAITSVPRTAWNPHFESHYSDFNDVVDHVRKLMAENQLSWDQDFIQERDHPEWITCLTTIVHAPSGQWKTTRCSNVTRPKVKRGEAPRGAEHLVAHDIAGGQMYVRRVGFMAAMGLVSAGEDDDGNEASGHGEGTKSQREDYVDSFLTGETWLKNWPFPGKPPSRDDLAGALKISHPIIQDIHGKLGRFGSISEKQINFVMNLAAEHGGDDADQSYADDPMAAPAEPAPHPAMARAAIPFSVTPEESMEFFKLLRQAGGDAYREGGRAAGPKHIKIPQHLIDELGSEYQPDMLVSAIDREHWDYLLEVLREQGRAGSQGGTGAAGGDGVSAGPDTGSTSATAKGGSQDSSHAGVAGSAGAKAAPTTPTGSRVPPARAVEPITDPTVDF